MELCHELLIRGGSKGGEKKKKNNIRIVLLFGRKLPNYQNPEVYHSSFFFFAN